MTTEKPTSEARRTLRDVDEDVSLSVDEAFLAQVKDRRRTLAPFREKRRSMIDPACEEALDELRAGNASTPERRLEVLQKFNVDAKLIRAATPNLNELFVGPIHLAGNGPGGAGPHWDATRVPGYDGSQHGFRSFIDPEYTSSRRHQIDYTTGRVRITSQWNNSDATDLGFAQTLEQAQLFVWFLTPHSGHLEVEIEGRRINDFHDLTIHDEAGWSDFTLLHETRLMMHVIDSNTTSWSSLVLRKDLYSNDGDWAHEILGSGPKAAPSSFIHRLTSIDLVPGGVWRVVRFGIDAYTHLITNDMSVNCRSEMTYIFDRIRLRML